MGDMADWQIDNMIDADTLGYEGYRGYSGVHCKFCGKGAFYWSQTDHGWRLFGAGGVMHSCREHETEEPGNA